MKNVFVILHDIRSVHNVGSVFRTADASGVSKIYLSDITPAPLDRFGRKRSPLAKVALGAEETVLWESYDDIFKLISELKKKGVRVVAVEQSQYSVDYRSISLKDSVAFIFGNENNGLSEEIIGICDDVIEIPMKGVKESLNVSVTAGIILFRMVE